MSRPVFVILNEPRQLHYIALFKPCTNFYKLMFTVHLMGSLAG